MSIAYYTVQLYPKVFPKAIILRVFRDVDGDVETLETLCFPIHNPHNVARSLNDARVLGDLIVKSVIL